VLGCQNGQEKELCRASNGLFVRNLGWKQTPAGYAQHKFYLGRDESKAMLAGLKLEQLWGQVEKRWERDNRYSGKVGTGKINSGSNVHA